MAWGAGRGFGCWDLQWREWGSCVARLLHQPPRIVMSRCRDVGRSSPRALYESTPSSAELMTSLSAAFTLQPGGVAGGQVPLQPPRCGAWKCVLLPPAFSSHVTFHTKVIPSTQLPEYLSSQVSSLDVPVYIFSCRCGTCVQRWRSIVFFPSVV